MEPFTLAALAALALKVTSLVKFLAARSFGDVLTQLVAWIAGVGVILIAANADITSDLVVAGNTLGSMNFWSQVLVGLSLGSLGSFAYDVKAAVDNTDTAREPSIPVSHTETTQSPPQ
jgi:hypothetical protein